MLKIFIWTIYYVLPFVVSRREPFIGGGDFADITAFPHSAFFTANCVKKFNVAERYTCGGSILNQLVVLTAAHCLFGCTPLSYFAVSVGHENKKMGSKSSTHSFLVHENFDEASVYSDIGILRLNNELTFSNRVKRVAVMKNPPYSDVASVAGWGLIDDENCEKIGTDVLKYIKQDIWARKACIQRLNSIPTGTICASAKDRKDYVAKGDSGSALVVRGYIQIGIVSYKVPNVANNLAVNTDVGYFYDWIQNKTKFISCYN